jgi:hypothetical protein
MADCNCLVCILAPGRCVAHSIRCREPERRSRRLAAKERVDYTEEFEPSRRSQEKQDKTYRLIGMTFAEFARQIRTEEGLSWFEANHEASERLKDLAADVDEATYQANIMARAAERLQVRAERVRVRAQAAVARQDAALRRHVERVLNQLEREAAMPSTPPRLVRQDAVTGEEAPWAPPHGPALSRTEATGCELPPQPNWVPYEWTSLPPPPPLRRVCASPDCDEDCKRCRYNDRLAEFNRNRPLPTGPAIVPNIINAEGALAPPPIGATIVRVPVDLRLMTAAALRELMAAAAAALNSAE